MKAGTKAGITIIKLRSVLGVQDGRGLAQPGDSARRVAAF